jgi:hypothetical protein
VGGLTKGVRRYADLPAGAATSRRSKRPRQPAALISTGSDREDTIVRDDSVVATG